MDGLEYFIGRLALYDSLAEWLHTLASFLGLAVAIYLPILEYRRARKSAQLRQSVRARSLALAIFPELLELRPRVDYLARNIGHLLGDARGRELHDRLGRAFVILPSAMQRSVPVMHLLGDAAGAEVQQLIALLGQYNRMVELLRAELARGAPMTEGYFPSESLRPHLETARALADNAIALVGRIQDGEPLPVAA